MKITIFCAGTRGDIQPLTALGVGLQRHGHRVTLATSHNFETFVAQAGLVYAPLTADYDRLMRQAPEMLESGMNVFRGSKIMVRPLHRQPVERRRVLYGYSERILPRSRDWPQNIQVTGFWFLDAADGWQPPDDLLAFLAAGSKPIYVGFGSMYPRDPKRITATMIAAIRKAGCRAIIAKGWGGLVPDEAAGDPNIYLLQQAPHDWLFPRMAAAVHHGGAGTTAAAVRAGIPSLILPFITEQAFWSVQLEKLGVAAPRLNRNTVTTEQLASGISRVQNRTMREEQRRLAKKFAPRTVLKPRSTT